MAPELTRPDRGLRARSLALIAYGEVGSSLVFALGGDDPHLIEALRLVTPQDVAALAGRLFADELLSLAVIAPRGSERRLESALRLP